MKQRVASLLVTVVLVGAACSGGSDGDASGDTIPASAETGVVGTLPVITDPPETSPPATDPPATDPPATDPPATDPPATDPPTTDPPVKEPPTSDPRTSEEPSSDTERIEVVGEGLLTMTVGAGWEVTGRTGRLGRFFGNDPWEIAPESLELMFALANGDVELTVFREGTYFTAPDVIEWTSALVELSAISVNVSATNELAGGRGQAISGSTLDGERIRLTTTEVGGQYVAIAVVSSELLSEEISSDVDAMLDSVVIDPSVVPLLAHSIDMKTVAAAQDTGSTPWEMGVLAPARWQVTDRELQWEDRDGEGFAEYWTSSATDDFETMAAEEMQARGDDWLSETPTIESRIVDRVPVQVYWEGDPETATAAIVMSHDGVVFAAIYIFAPSPAGLAQAMVDSVALPVSSFNPS